MPNVIVKENSSQYGPLILQAVVLFASISGSLGGAVSAQEQKVRIFLTKESVTVDSSVLCSEEDLKVALSEHAKQIAIHVENEPSIDTKRVLRLLKMIRDLGYENVTSTGAGQPGWTLYPLPDDLDVFGCEEQGE